MIKALRVALVTIACALPCLAPFGAWAQETLRVGIYPNNSPWEFYDAKGVLVGFEIDVVEAMGKRIGARIGFVPMPFRDLLPALKADRIDIAACTITITGERAEQYDFTQPYYRTSQGMVVMKGSGIRALEDLAGKKVSAEAGSTNEQWLAQNGGLYRLGPTVPSEGLRQGLDLLQSGKVDAYFGDLPALLYQLLKRTDLAVVARLPTEDRYAMVLPKNSRLTDRVDSAIAELKRDGTLARIHQKWFGSQPEPGSPVTMEMPRP